MLKRAVRGGFRALGFDVVRRSPPSPPSLSFDNGWAEERRYWLQLMREQYRTRYGLDLHPAQTDPSLVPRLETVVKVQNPDKADPDAFVASGCRTVLGYQKELLDYGESPDRLKNVLELGAGFGRLLLHWFPFEANLYACDVTPEAVEWIGSKLSPRVRVELTGTEPPLPYTDGLFDFVYANSVFTHVPCSLTDSWAAELRRVIRPGGTLILSVLDANHYLGGLTYRDFHRDFQARGCRDWDPERGVLMMVYHSRDFLFDAWGRHFRVLELRSQFRDQSHLILRRE